MESDDGDIKNSELDIDIDQDGEIYDDVDMAVTVLGSRPVVVELDTEVDKGGELDQDTNTSSDTGGSGGGRDIDVAGEQRPEVDQRIDVDIEVSEDDGVVVIEIDAEVEDDVEIESDVGADIDDDDEDSFAAEVDQDSESDGNVDVDVEVRGDLDAEIDLDILSLVETAVAGTVDWQERDDGTAVDIDLYEQATADGDVGVIIDVSDI